MIIYVSISWSNTCIVIVSRFLPNIMIIGWIFLTWDQFFLSYAILPRLPLNSWRHQAITSTNVSIFSIWSLGHDQWKHVSENQNLKKCIYVAFAIDDLAWHIVSQFRSVEAMTYSSWSSCSVDEYATLLGHQHTQCLYNTPDAVSCGMVRDCFLLSVCVIRSCEIFPVCLFRLIVKEHQSSVLLNLCEGWPTQPHLGAEGQVG